jgi:AcrR family transcriptional regulator
VSRVYRSAVPVEKLTRERRRQQTREVLIAAATEVFAKRGYEGASLEEIAETAGFTRGAIYKNFAGKEELFYAVTDGLNEQIIEAFRAIAPTAADDGDWDVSALADLWKKSASGFQDLMAVGMEYQLFILRNPKARKRALAHRRKHRAQVASFIEEVATRSNLTLRLPADTLAAVILATADGLSYSASIDGDDLFGPFLEVLNAGMFVD